MARNLQVYPKVFLEGSTWNIVVKVMEAGNQTKFKHIITANVVATTSLQLLKIVFKLVVDDTDTDQDVDDALFIDDIRPGLQVETVWTNWQTIAEGIIEGLNPEYTINDFWVAWSKADTNQMRKNVQRAFVTQRGWTITGFHQHEGNGTVLEG